jgi:hypothetical protein
MGLDCAPVASSGSYRGLLGIRHSGSALLEPVELREHETFVRCSVLRADLLAQHPIGDDDPPPVLLISGCRSLHGEFEALKDDVRRDGSYEIQAATDRAGRGQHSVDGVAVEIVSGDSAIGHVLSPI